MKAKKRAPGGGRKPQGRITGKSAAFTTRITPETRKALEDACGPGKSLSQVAEEMLRAGLMARERADDPARAICYLIAELAKCCGAEDAGQRRGPDRIATDKFAAHEDESQRSDKIFDHDTREYNPMPVREPEPKFDWVTDPFSFRAFKLAVGQLLDLLEPQGEIISTVDRLGEDVFRGAPSAIVDSYRTPEARAQAAIMLIWSRTQMPATDDELALARNWRPFGARFERMNRAMFDVRSHLPNISPKGK